ncbi:MFS transporter [Terrilactibacillus sp. S3-3]|nr:MFS transporter [Terrilactibacillus sp. S3-3]
MRETLSESRREKRGISGTFSNLGGLFRDRMFMGYALSQGLIMAAMFCYISGSSFVLQNMFGLSSLGFSFVFAVNGMGIIFASQLTGLLSGKVGEKKLLVVGLAVAACGSIGLFGSLFVHPARLIMVVIPLFFIVSMVGVVSTTAFSLAMQNQGRAAGSASAILGMGMNVIGGALAPLVGLGGSHTYFPMSLLILICDVGALLSYLLILKKRA